MSMAKNDSLMIAIFEKFKWWLLASASIAAIISMIYTVKFNRAQANDADDQNLLAVTGVVQDMAEYPFIVIGLIMLFMVRGWFFRITGAVMATIGVTLLLWSIAATFGSNNAIIGESVARTQLAETQLALVNQVVQNSTATAETMQANAAATRQRAESYSTKYNMRAAQVLEQAQGQAQQAAEENSKALAALENLNNIDQDALTQRNSAVELFNKMAVFLGVDRSTVENMFLLTRAGQLEFITAFGVLVSVLVLVAAWRSGNHQPTTDATFSIKPTWWNGVKGWFGGAGKRLKENAEKGMDEAARQGGKLGGDIALAGSGGRSNLTEAKPDERRKPRPKMNAKLMKTAMLPEFRTIAIRIISGDIDPVHNQISKKLKLTTPQKSLDILTLLEALGWIYQNAADKTRHLEAQHTGTRQNLPLSAATATTEIDKTIAFVKAKLSQEQS